MDILTQKKDKVDIPIDPEAVKAEILAKYPTKVARKRAKQIQVPSSEENLEAVPEIMANVRTIPGILTMRGCCYAGCKGVVLGPTRDIVNLTHGPIGCGFYSWLTRRNQTQPHTPDDDNFMTYCFSTDMQDSDIVFGGEKKLKQAIQEAYDTVHPKAIGIFSTCPVGLIGDDVHAVAREMKARLGINIFGFSCEGYKGVSQSAGHHIANNQIFKHVVGSDDEIKGDHKFRINLLGEYNIGGDAFIIEDLLDRCGIGLVSTFSGNSTIDQFANCHTADLNCIMCHRSINYVAEMLEVKFGIPWLKINFIGAEATAKSLRKIAEYFGDDELKARVEEVIAEEMPAVQKAIEEVRPHTEGKLSMMFVGGSRAHHYQGLFREIGMHTIAAGYEFAHRDDYEGRQVLPNIKMDADSRNIEELDVEPDPERFKPRKSPEEMAKLDVKVNFKRYDGMMVEMSEKSLIIDDLNEYEAEKLCEIYKPALFCAGIKEKFGTMKSGTPYKQLHSYDSHGPYAAFKGAINFYHEVDRLVNAKLWNNLKAPWQEHPELAAEYCAS